MKKIYTLLLMLVAFSLSLRLEAQVACNWKSNNPTAKFWDSCNVTTKNYALNGYLSFNSSKAKCFKYTWSVNGSVVGTGNYIQYQVKTNGQYNLCVKVTDTCANCDTTFCSTRNITCIPASGCNWKSRYPTAVFWDSCNVNTQKYALNGYISFNSNLYQCFKYTWTVNGNVVKTGNSLAYNITQNGTYNVCVKVMDTCNNCDTVFCSTRTISCIPGSGGGGCNWKSRNPTAQFWDSCGSTVKKYAINGYISFNWNNYTCLKYTWKVNGNVVGTGSYINYPITSNGSYALSVSVKDTCNNCDTVFSSTRNITCIPNSGGGCNWKSRYPTAQFWDSCGSTVKKYAINGYISFNWNNYTCLKYTWKVNGSVVGTGNYINYPVNANGNYTLSVTVSDTCNRCDTVFSSTRNITCIPGSNSGCNWKSKYVTAVFWDSCNSSAKKYNLYGYLNSNYLTGCWKITWAVNGVNVGTGTSLNYSITQNGTYNVCAKVVDTCAKCDTVFCSSRNITCIPTSGNGCNWKANYSAIYMKDSCDMLNKKYKLMGYFANNSGSKSCFKYTWKVNGAVVGDGMIFSYAVTKNGTYQVCLYVKDTCNNCDTSICQAYNVTCIPNFNGGCNWKSLNPVFTTYDTCYSSINKNSLIAYVSFRNAPTSCYKYTWMVNGVIISRDYYMNRSVSSNGSYRICVKVTDTCRGCDTTFCATRNVTCLSTNHGNCNWKSRYPSAIFWDSCNTTKNVYMLNGACYFNSNLVGCFKYTWAVNGIVIGNGNKVNFPVTMNGNYELCVKVTDTCNNCDTVICSVRQINCIPPTVGVGTVEIKSMEPEVYPNPASGMIYIRHELKSGNYMMFDMTGKMVRNGKLNDAVQEIDLTGLSDGCYMIRCESAEGIYNKKVIIQHGN